MIRKMTLFLVLVLSINASYSQDSLAVKHPKNLYPIEISYVVGPSLDREGYSNQTIHEVSSLIGVNLGIQNYLGQHHALGAVVGWDVIPSWGTYIALRARYSAVREGNSIFDLGVGPILTSSDGYSYSMQMNWNVSNTFNITLKHFNAFVTRDSEFTFYNQESVGYTGLGLQVKGKPAKWMVTIGGVALGILIVAALQSY